MNFLRRMIKFLTNRYILLLTILLLITYIIVRIFIPLQLVTSNITWIYSSSMQTLAALIALLPISYGYYINNIDNEKSDDFDSYVIDRLKSDVYYEMMTVIIYSMIVIVINLLGFFVSYNIQSAFVLALLSIEAIGLILVYIFRLFDPNKVKELLKEFDTKTDTENNNPQISLDTFITSYLELETAVKDFISNENDNELIDKLPLYDIVDNLSKDFVEINNSFDTFKEIIFHRNNVIHNYIDTVVDYNKYTKLLELKDSFVKLNQNFVQKKIFTSVTKIRKNIEISLHEFLSDSQNVQVDTGVKLDKMKEDITSLLHSYFVNDYYFTLSLEDAKDTDFEIVQNNFSERRLAGIDIKSITPKKLHYIATNFFTRLENRFMYVFLINFDAENNEFTIMYQTKDKELRSMTVN